MNANTTSTRQILRGGLWSAGVCLAMAGAAFAQTPQGGEPAGDVQVTDYGTVTLTVKDTDLAQVLEMLSIQSRKNIITSKQVAATVSANLYDVTFYEALDAILRVNGYGYLEEGNFIYVYTQEELETIKTQRRQTTSRVYELEYLSAADAHEMIQPLLSDMGKSSFRGEVQPGFKPDVADGGADSFAYNAKLLVTDYLENLDAISEVITEVDTQPQQVLVECTILQTTLDESNAWGVDWAIIDSVDFTNLTNPLSLIGNLLDGNESGADTKATKSDGFSPGDNEAAGGTVTVGNTAGPGNLKVGIVRDSVAAFIRVLDEVTDNTVLARPKIMCLNRQRAEVLVGARVGYLSTTATQTTSTQSVEFLDTGIQMIFRPFISRSGMIRLELAPSVSEASLRTITDANGLLVTIPDEITNELTTNVRVPDGETLVLGGLFRESTRVTRRQVPWLGDVPILGAAFRGQDDAVDRDEITFLITPTIIDDEVLTDIGKDMLAYADSVRVGGRTGLLPFSRERMTTGYNQDAMEAYQRGDCKMALYHVNNSLRLYRTQPEMVRFREQVGGAKDRVHERSMLDRVLRREFGKVSKIDSAPHEVAVSVPLIPASRGRTTQTPQGSPFGGLDSFQTPGAPASGTTSGRPVPLTLEQQEFYDDLFRSFFESLGLPELAGQPGGTSTVSVTEPLPPMEFPFTTFEEMGTPEMGSTTPGSGASDGMVGESDSFDWQWQSSDPESPSSEATDESEIVEVTEEETPH